MEEKEFGKLMNEIKKPNVTVDQHKQLFKIYILSAKRASLLGLLLIIIPFMFMAGAIAKYEFDYPLWPFSHFADWIISIDPDSNSSIVSWIIRFSLVGFPVLAIIFNLMSVMHVYFSKVKKEIVLTFKLKWVSWAIIFFCLVIFLLFAGFLFVENFNHNIE